MKRLENKIAVITGGTSGIGFATAKKFLAEGATVAVFARKRDELDKAVSQLGKGCFAYQGDVTKQEDIENLYSDVHKRLVDWTSFLPTPDKGNSLYWMRQRTNILTECLTSTQRACSLPYRERFLI